MKLKDSFKTASLGLKHAKIRSILTILGIIIGVGSVILLMSIGNSAQILILNQVQGAGSNLVFIVPGATKGSRFSSPASVQGIIIKTLVKEDLEAIKKDQAIEKAAPEARGQGRISYSNNDAAVSFEGTTGDFFTIRNFSVEKGRIFSNADVDSFSRVIVLGQEIAKTLFGDINPIDKTVRLKEVSFKVIGVLEKKGLGPFGIDQDNIALIPVSVAQKQMLGISYYNSIVVQASDAYNIEYAKERITSILRQNHRIDNPDKDDFTIRTQEDALSLLGNITSILSAFLTAIASISLVVGGIGVMNIMLVSVVERTKEIGLRKAVGATNGDILQQFLLEAIILAFIGGVAGIILGSSLAFIISLFLKSYLATGWVFSLPFSAILWGVGVSTATGIIFGIYPARQASLKSPIEALRYE